MKKIVRFFAYTALVCTMVSCGLQKKVVLPDESALGTEVENIPAMMYKLDAGKGVLRGNGSYNDSDMNYAYRGANANARADVADQISAKLKAAVDLYKEKHGKGVNDIDRSDSVSDTAQGDNFTITQIAGEVVVGAKAVKVNTYKQKNGTFTTHICVEVDSDMIAEQIASSKKLQNLLTDDEKLKIDFNEKQFKEEMQKLFDEYKQERMQ